ncbi:hypothetical protein ABFS83_04G049300 [Erythranthe nasuta]
MASMTKLLIEVVIVCLAMALVVSSTTTEKTSEKAGGDGWIWYVGRCPADGNCNKVCVGAGYSKGKCVTFKDHSKLCGCTRSFN